MRGSAFRSTNNPSPRQTYNGCSNLNKGKTGEGITMKHRGLLACLSVTLMLALCPILSFATEADSSEPSAASEPDVVLQEPGDPSNEALPAEPVDAADAEPAAEGKEAQTVDSARGEVVEPSEQEEATPSTPLSTMEDSDAEPGAGEEAKSYDIADYPITLSATTLWYKGKGVYPTVQIPGLTEGEDFQVYYDDWDNSWWNGYSREDDHSGTYSLEVYGIGEYYGSTTCSYKVIETWISLSKTSATIYREGTTQIQSTVRNAEGSTTYESSNASVATVSATGTVTGKSAGTAKITVKNGYAKRTFTVKVKDPTLNKKTATLYVGETFSLSVKGAIGKCSFKSSNKKIATVSKKGVVKAKAKGKCTIAVKANGLKLKCTVKVKAPKLSKKKMTVYNSYTKKLAFYGGKGKIKWSSSNKSIATVSKKGTVKGKKGGTCTITAKRGKYTLKCKVTVPKHYEGYAKIPDFGALYGKTEDPSNSGHENNMTYSVYKAKKSLANQYKSKLKKKGFSLTQKKGGNYLYVNSDYDIVLLAYAKGYVFVGYGNAWDSYDDGSDSDDDDYDDDDYDDDDYDDYDDYDDDTYDDEDGYY